MTYCILAADPGAHGALALLDPTNGDLEIIDMPIHIIKVGKSKKAKIDLYELSRWIDARKEKIKKAVVESVSSSPQMGVSSSFSFGEAYGSLKGIISANFIPMQLVTPPTWKKYLGLIGAEKDSSRRRASELMPQHAEKWSRKMDDGRAESALIAWWAANQGL